MVLRFLNSPNRTIDGGANAYINNKKYAGSLRISAAGNNPFIFLDSSTGRVGINETKKATALHVLGTMTANYFIGTLNGHADGSTRSYRLKPYANE